MEDYLARGVLTVANGQTKLRTIQTRLMAGEIRDEMEHVEPYGFTSEPHVDAETFSLFFDGDLSHGEETYKSLMFLLLESVTISLS